MHAIHGIDGGHREYVHRSLTGRAHRGRPSRTTFAHRQFYHSNSCHFDVTSVTPKPAFLEQRKVVCTMRDFWAVRWS